MELKPHHIVDGSNNIKRINTVRAKTDIRVNVPLLQPAAEILDKYRNDESAIYSQFGKIDSGSERLRSNVKAQIKNISFAGIIP